MIKIIKFIVWCLVMGTAEWACIKYQQYFLGGALVSLAAGFLSFRELDMI
jgi:hypothetical protein